MLRASNIVTDLTKIKFLKKRRRRLIMNNPDQATRAIVAPVGDDAAQSPNPEGVQPPFNPCRG
ncbi:hypothetical protein FACS1894139_17060 [Planctomycetales bacterium]|nr:hypothetical protein FACS1894107_13800 [Planctomycetales bacterium]GHT07976.1 hypothetical protein FACS1894139_17060 [Planctomycetales bacterium]